jgi:hypothetical protein
MGFADVKHVPILLDFTTRGGAMQRSLFRVFATASLLRPLEEFKVMKEKGLENLS